MKRVTTCMMLILCMTSFAQNSPALLDKIKQESQKITSITSSFKQSAYMDFIDEEVISEGKFYYRKPDKLLMKYDQPKGEMMLINGDNIAMKTEEGYRKMSAKSDPVAGLINTIFSSCLEGNPRKIEGAAVAATEKAEYYEVTINFKGEKAKNIQAVKAYYDKNDLSLIRLRTEDPEGGHTTYELKKKKLNQPIADNIFSDPGK